MYKYRVKDKRQRQRQIMAMSSDSALVQHRLILQYISYFDLTSAIHDSANVGVAFESSLVPDLKLNILWGKWYPAETAHYDRLKDNPKCTVFIQQKGICTHTPAFWWKDESFLVLDHSCISNTTQKGNKAVGFTRNFDRSILSEWSK